MTASSPPDKSNKIKIGLCRNRRKVWLVSFIAIIFSVIGFLTSTLNPNISSPIRLGIDFTGGTQIQLERICEESCDAISSNEVLTSLAEIPLNENDLKQIPNLSQSKVQLLDDYKSIVIRMPFLSASQGKQVIEIMSSKVGPLKPGGQDIAAIGPKLGSKLFKSSFVSLLAAFAGISFYISLRYDKRFALLALIALAHDVIIVCGIFSWLGILTGLEVDSLFAVSLLTIAGYSVNDTVVVFDRIREFNNYANKYSYAEQIDNAVSATLTRTIYTTGTTILPLLALIVFGGKTLFWFAIALVCGLVIGSWSSIALAPSLLSISEQNKNYMNLESEEILN